jgi:NADH:ubiquinone oxidoreductase subunit 6 (subunit J)
LNPTIQALVFYGLAALTIITAMMATFYHNIFKSACALFFTFLGLAGLFAMLGADFLAVTQVVVYVGGILTLILFGVLLTSPINILLKLDSRTTFVLAFFAGLLLLGMLSYVVYATGWPELPAEVVDQQSPTTRDIGNLLLGRYLLPFEISSITLLIALIGAAYMVRRRDD